MGIYLEKLFKKDKNGKLKLQETKIVKAPHDVGRWQRSIELERNGKTDWSVMHTDVTRSGLNKKVTSIRTKLGNDEIVDRKLITTASRLSRKDYEKYKHIKGADCPIKR